MNSEIDFAVAFSAPEKVKSDTLICGIYSDHYITQITADINRAIGGQIKKVIDGGDHSGKVGEVKWLYSVEGINAKRILLLGMGDKVSHTLVEFKKSAKAAARALHKSGANNALLSIPALLTVENEKFQRLIIRAFVESSREELYKYEINAENRVKNSKNKTLKITISPAERSQLKTSREALNEALAIADGSNLARTLGNLPGNICTPSYLATKTRALGRNHKSLTVKILTEKMMEKLRMGALLSVSKGSSEEAKLIIAEYSGGTKKELPIVLVGKGVTFDSGGISLKPGSKMDEMKFDMCGAAAVLGTLQAVRDLKLPINLVAIVPATENLPSGSATKPGDVVTSMSGQTIEVLNTDAEGRLILCDALTYSERFKPAEIIDVATLTGACVVALGKHASGLMSNNDKLAKDIITAGESSGDRVWQLPLWDEYQSQLDSNFADIANIGTGGAGTVTAACFLSRFTKDQRWAHLDIAGTAWVQGKDKGATGRPVALLVQHLINRSKK